jgi:DNA polymerase-3 subunit epsilon
LRTFKNEALDIDIMHRKLNDITDKQFNLEELSATYNVSKRNSSSEDAYKIALLF